MNIFVTDIDPAESAIVLDDLRLNKMILETGQILSTAYRHIFRISNDKLYKSVYENHKVVKWSYENIDNFCWLVEYFNYLHEEYFYRKACSHATYDLLGDIFNSSIEEIHYLPPKLFCNCTPYDDDTSIFYKYRRLLVYKWLHDKKPPSWTNRGFTIQGFEDKWDIIDL